MPEPTVRPTRYTVTRLPESDINYRHAAIHITYLGGGFWDIENMGAYLHPDGSWRDLERHCWPDLDSARAAAVAAIDTTPAAQASAALNRRQEPTP